ncbi:bifunctional (p)ppGpp synthetase/guanosine-3',5'-bis(diphosphate) 3'-pyrophosphohydrolase [Prolixibacteraceae bacterium JC049]|nr:bifunctional (p)ppGpp synthetase/guanosine-3',5'-bis(diphosphate) 3'-pyrophosphohydrolase [Prolixibacteraceae bacterium JC049]
MNLIKNNTTPHTEDVPIVYSELRSICAPLLGDEELALVDKAFEYVKQIIGDKCWEWGEPILHHSVEVAKIVVKEVGLGVDSILTAILHNAFEEQEGAELKYAEIEKLFGRPVKNMLEGINKINGLDTETISVHSENYRRLMLALSGDVRVILIKIADRLHDMRTLDWVSDQLKHKYASETSYLYAPLAHRMGLYVIKSELEDLALRTLNAEAYKYIENRLKETEVQRQNFVADFVRPISERLKKKNFKFEMKSRTKSIYSIWNKMNKSKVDFDEVFDLFAIRVILDSKLEEEKSECWQVYSMVTETYQPNTERMRDWVSIPKSNGYESLHTTVMGPGGKWVEVQIRTQRMDEVAEKGLAAHWKYKGGKGNKELDEWLSSIREILESKETSIVDFIDDFQKNIYDDEIFVFTPKGDLKKISGGATLLDFAYDIHSHLGDQCTGGKVNGRHVTIKHVLKNGDQVEIETSKNQKPKVDWLEFVTTSKAKNRIKSSLNEAKKLEAAHGKEIILRKFKNWKLEFNDEAIRLAIKHFKLKYAIDLYYNISVEKIDPLEIKNLITGKEEKSEQERVAQMVPEEELKSLHFSEGEDFLVIDNNLEHVTYKLAPCCNPIPGDNIFGFVTIKEGIKIHRHSCPNAKDMMERYPYRVIKARWKNADVRNAFQATIRISGDDQIGLIGEITNSLAKDFQIQIRSISVDSDNKGEFFGTIRLLVFDTGHLEFVMQRLKQINGVRHVSRGD